MLEARRDERLAHEARRLGCRFGLQLLESHRPAEPPVAGREDAAHAAAGELALDGVVLAGHERERRDVSGLDARRDRGSRELGLGQRQLRLGFRRSLLLGHGPNVTPPRRPGCRVLRLPVGLVVRAAFQAPSVTDTPFTRRSARLALEKLCARTPVGLVVLAW